MAAFGREKWLSPAMTVTAKMLEGVSSPAKVSVMVVKLAAETATSMASLTFLPRSRSRPLQEARP